MRVTPYRQVWNKTMNANKHIEYVQVPNTFLEMCTRNTSDEQMFSAADDIIKKLAVEFVHRLPRELLEIDEALAVLEAAPDDKVPFNAFFRLVHDLKGMAGTFDYMLLTVIGNDLCRFIEHVDHLTPRHMKVVRFHVEALSIVAQNRMVGDGDARGKGIVDTLHSMTQKVLQED